MVQKNGLGLVDWGEQPLSAAKRELREETGLEIDSLKPIGSKDYNWEGKQDTVYFYYAETAIEDIVIDDQEIIDAGWFKESVFPEPLSTTVVDALKAHKTLEQVIL